VTVLYVVIVLFIVAAMAALGRTFGRRRAR
jgi:hypothetical protein